MLANNQSLQSRTVRHLADHQYPGGVAVQLLRRPPHPHRGPRLTVVDYILAKHGDKTRKMNPLFEAPARPFLRMTYADAIQHCNEHGILNKGKPFVFGEDITEKPEREMTDMVGRPVFMAHFPALNAFYTRRVADNRTQTECVDLARRRRGRRRVGENRRLRRADRGRQGEQARPDAVLLVHGPAQVWECPHWGSGLGTEGFVMWLPGNDHIRNSAFPRAPSTAASRHHRFVRK